MSSDLTTIANGEPVVSTLTVAAQDGMPEHASIIRLVRDNKADFNQFGQVGFEIRARLPGHHGGGDTEHAILNERQATLLFTYMRNSPTVKAFKIRLVSEFYRMAEELKRRQAGPQTPQRVAVDVASAVLDFAALIEAPKHYALQVVGQEVHRQTGLDYSGLIGTAPAMQSITEDQVMLEPTELGEQVGMTARQVNFALQEAGLQTRRGKQWVPTDKGRELCEKHAWSKNGKSGYNLKWRSDKISALLD